jgi:hypothetical protein
MPCANAPTDVCSSGLRQRSTSSLMACLRMPYPPLWPPFSLRVADMAMPTTVAALQREEESWTATAEAL